MTGVKTVKLFPWGHLLRLLLAMCVLGVIVWSMPAKAAETMTLNFRDTDITQVIGAVAEMTGKNFVIDPRVKGKVTVISSHPMSAQAIYEVFLSVLKVHGFTAVPGKGVIKIVPSGQARQDDIPNASARHPGQGDEFVTRVIAVQHADVAQLVPILRPLVPQTGHLAAYPRSNVLVISDTAANIKRLVAIVERIDASGDQGVEIVPLQHATAGEVARVLDALIRSNAQPKAGNHIGVIADERSNSILLSGDRAQRSQLRTIITHLDTPRDTGGNTHVVYLHYANAKSLVGVLTGVGQSLKGGKAPATPQGKVEIQADESANALVIHAPPAVYRSLRAVISQLDVRRAQVLVEAVIAEVTAEKAKELGVQWVLDGTARGHSVGVVNFAGSGSGLSNLLEQPPRVSDGLSLGLGDFTGATRFGALIRALAGDSTTNILSTPSLVTMDNAEAEIVVGQNVPFITGQYTNTGGGTTPANPFQTIQRQDVGLTLKIKPQINEGNAIKLDVQQEVSSISPTSTGAADLITNKRSIKTSVMVDDGQIIVLGGLIQDHLTESEQKVPGLGDIPGLGWLFRYKKTSKVKTNLMVFLHPVILKDPSLTARYTGQKYDYMRAQQLAVRERGVALMDDKESPLLPDIMEYLKLPPPYAELVRRGQMPATPPLPGDSAQAAPAPGGTQTGTDAGSGSATHAAALMQPLKQSPEQPLEQPPVTEGLSP